MREKQPLWGLGLKADSYIKRPKEILGITLTVRNLSDSALYFSMVEIFPSWIPGKKGIRPVNMKNYLAAGDATFLPSFKVKVPSKPGLYTLKFGLETWIYNYYTANWENLGVLQTDDWGYIQVTPQPCFSAFISYSSRTEDIPIVEQIITMIELWGFSPIRVGIDVFSEDPAKIPDDIKNQIEMCNAFIGIATPRDYSFQERRFNTFPWLHVESGVAFRSDKPLLFIVDGRIKPEGFLEYGNFPKVFYHPTKLDILEHRLAVVMPGFRSWIAGNRQKDFWDGLGKAGLILGGICLVAKALEEKK
ncbi:MAG: hypothetical protein DDT42_02149 [candidate division WS2 bacterium]|uniref:TIR domain-containing protein n=1 Tax=Psychracetigena formicireducens TaxID=2986056 RepID=A0A9E2BIN3_PSYF1|nr:hypothetical protein [Candidatus Psychracetigena formicireducens]